MTTPLPRNETRRLLELRSHEIMDTAPEPAFERIVRVAARFFAMPMAAVSFVDEYRVWSKATHGPIPGEGSRDRSLCAHAILQERVLVVHDARRDPRLGLRPATDPLYFYAGAPLRTADGHALGALCVMDTSPRAFTQEDEDTLTDLAAIVMDEVNLRRLPNRLRAEIDDGRRKGRTLTRQHRLLQRLSGSLEGRIELRTAELTQANRSLQAEIARRERSEAALLRAKDEAERANGAKSDFLSRMSHELRTPLNAILGFGRILQRPLADEARRDCASHVVTAGRHLLTLINELLDIARIEAGHLEMELEPVPIAELVGETLALLRPLADERAITFDQTDASTSGHAVLADRQRLKQVLLNLLANAIKYSPPASRIVIACRPERARTLRLSVADSGPGVTDEQTARLFVAYHRAGAERSAVEGTGLGLAVSKRLIEGMGGSIGVETSPGSGSTFWVRLPSSPARISTLREAVPPDAYRAEPAPGATRTLLYIEDTLSNVRLIEHFLAASPTAWLVSARRGEEGLALARQARPDAILLDLHLPDLPGWEVLAKLRADLVTRSIPVVAVSADPTSETIERAMGAGARAYLPLPLDFDRLYNLLPEIFGPVGATAFLTPESPDVPDLFPHSA